MTTTTTDTTTTQTTQIIATDNHRRSMSRSEAWAMYTDCRQAAIDFGVETKTAVYTVNLGDLRIVFDWSRNKLVITDHTGDLLMVATSDLTGRSIGIVSWRQAGWCWRQTLRQSIKAL